jgi:DNA-binding NtrC family response regulator
MPHVKLTGKRLLFVDDERGIRETLAIILLRCGFTVTLFATVKEAPEKIQAQEFDTCCFPTVPVLDGSG